MANYSFFNVDAQEFEEICSEVLSILLKTNLRVFPAGKDRGIDIKKASGEEDIIGQCKRTRTVSPPTIKDELQKIRKIYSCKKYYLFFACEITAKRRTEFYNLFSSYMEDESFILDAIDLNSLLEKDEYQDVVKKHFKLWISSEKLFDLFLNKASRFDSSALVTSIQSQRKYYVDTSDYYRIVQKLFREHIVLITGAPGVGKSTLSEMAVLRFIDEYPTAKLVYSSSNDIAQIKNTLSENKNLKELVFLDDFLGDYYLDLKANRLTEMAAFINGIKSYENKYLLINSRGVILAEAREKSPKFQKAISSIETCSIEIKSITQEQKARILYNHLIFSRLPTRWKKEIVEKKFYWDLIKHPNYNPRLIEYLCNADNFERSSHKSFCNFAMECLDKADKIWADAIRNNLAEVDRLFLMTLKSFSQDSVSTAVFEPAFNHVLKSRPSIDKSVNYFKDCLKRLSGSFVIIIMNGETTSLALANPSIKESIESHLPNGEKDFVSFEQFYYNRKSFLTSETFKKLCLSGRIYKLLLNSITFKDAYLLLFANNTILDDNLSEMFVQAIASPIRTYSILNLSASDVYKKLLKKVYIDFYCINSLDIIQISRIVENIFKMCTESEIVEVLAMFDPKMIKSAISISSVDEVLINLFLWDRDWSDIVRSFIDEDGLFDEKGAKKKIYDVAIQDIHDSSLLIDLSEQYGFELNDMQVWDETQSMDFKQEIENYLTDYSDEKEMEWETKKQNSTNIDDLFMGLIEQDQV